jgi:nucleoside-diphosphate-sugar epimerase
MHYLRSRGDIPIIYDLKEGQDIMNRDQLDSGLQGMDACFHLAAVPSVKYCEDYPFEASRTNVVGTLNVAEACVKHGVRMIFASSFAVQHPKNSRTVYGITKALGEKLVVHHGGVVCRLSNVYGGINYTELKDSVVARLMKGTFEDRGHGDEERDFIHVDQVCEQLVSAYFGDAQLLQICTGKLTSIADLVELSKDPEFPRNI